MRLRRSARTSAGACGGHSTNRLAAPAAVLHATLTERTLPAYPIPTRMASRRPTHKSVLGSWNPSTGTSALLLVVVLLCGATLPPATADDGWKNGRATWYGLNDGESESTPG